MCIRDRQEAASSEAEAASTEAAAATEASTEASTETAAGESTASTEYNPSGELNLIHYLTETAKLQALDDLVAGFQEEYPDVTVNVEAMSMDNYTDVIKLRFSTDEAPDIIFGQPKSYSDLVENGLIKMCIRDRKHALRCDELCFPGRKAGGKEPEGRTSSRQRRVSVWDEEG